MKFENCAIVQTYQRFFITSVRAREQKPVFALGEPAEIP